MHRAALAPISRAAQAPIKITGSVGGGSTHQAEGLARSSAEGVDLMPNVNQETEPMEAMMSDTALKRISALKLDEKKSWANDLINEAPLVSVRILRNQCQRYVTLNRKDKHLWPCVARRITKDLETSEVLADEDVTQMTNEELHRTLDKPRNIRVEFYAHKNCDESSGSEEEEECAP